MNTRDKNVNSDQDNSPSNTRESHYTSGNLSFFKVGLGYAPPKQATLTAEKSQYGTEGRPKHIMRYKGNEDGIGFYDVPEGTILPSKAPEKVTKLTKRVSRQPDESKNSDQSETKSRRTRCLIS